MRDIGDKKIVIQDECVKIHSKYGISELANYKIQKLSERYADEIIREYVRGLSASYGSEIASKANYELKTFRKKKGWI